MCRMLLEKEKLQPSLCSDINYLVLILWNDKETDVNYMLGFINQNVIYRHERFNDMTS